MQVNPAVVHSGSPVSLLEISRDPFTVKRTTQLGSLVAQAPQDIGQENYGVLPTAKLPSSLLFDRAIQRGCWRVET